MTLIKGQTITMAARQGTEITGLKKLKGQWEQRTGNKVNLIEMPSSNYLQEKIFTDVKSNLELYDVVLIDDPWFPALVTEGYLTPLFQFGYATDPDFINESLVVCLWPPPNRPFPLKISPKETPKLYALPFVGNVQLFVYRQDYLPNPPTTMPEMLTLLAQKIQPEKELYGYAYRGQGGSSLVTEFNAWNWSYGGDIFDEDWQVIINQPASVQALTDFLRAVELASPDSANYGSPDILPAVLNAVSLTAVSWPADLSQKDHRQINVMPFPKVFTQTSQLGNWLLAIPITAPHKEVAFDFMVWATSPEVMKEMARLGTPPTRKSVFEDPELVKELWWLSTTEQALENSRPRPRLPEWSKVEQVMAEVILRAIRHELTPQQALDRANERIDIIMQQAGYIE
jgi:multiple sugar transport system substrate-binding protein